MDDFIFIGSPTSGHCCTWDEFCEMSNTMYAYNASKGDPTVAADLIIAFKDGAYLCRELGRGDCALWVLIEPFVMPSQAKPMTRVIASHEGRGRTLSDMNANKTAQEPQDPRSNHMG